MNEFQPSRQKSDLADVVEMLLDKGVVINADIAVSVGDTQLLGVQIRAALASFETAAKYGLEFPEGTDMRRVAAAADAPELLDEDEGDRPDIPVDATRGVNVGADPDEREETADGESRAASGGSARGSERLGARPDPGRPFDEGDDGDRLDDAEPPGRDEAGPDGDAASDGDESSGGEPASLEAIDGVGPSKADALRDAGFDSVAAVRDATSDELTEADGVGDAVAERIAADVDARDGAGAGTDDGEANPEVADE